MISVILPTFNGEKYLAQAIQSVIDQSYHDWELIVVDDGSTDGTYEIALSFARRDSRIRVLRNEINQNLPNALNRGFEYASGELLTWTSDDNYYHDNAFEVMKKYLEEHPDMPMVRANYRRIGIGGNEYEDKKTFIADELLLECNIGACFMYRRETADAVGVYDPEWFCVEDYEYWLRMYTRYKQIGNITECLYTYRYQPKSLTETRKREIWDKGARLLWQYCDYVLEHFADHKDFVTRFYCSILARPSAYHGEWETFYRVVPELEFDSIPKQDQSIIIYGAGELGSRVHDSLGERVAAFADSDPKKWGKTKEGLTILPPEEAIQQSGSHYILIAIEEKHVYEVIHMLYENGVRRYCTWQQYEAYVRYNEGN